MTETTSDQNHPDNSQPDNAERYRSVGAQLRRRREALDLKQVDVARDLHLPGIVVDDLENGKIEQLSSLYRRGYIRNYARLLELDADRLLTEAGEDVPPELREVLPASKSGWQLDRYLKIATYAIVTVAIVPPLVYFFIAGGTRMLDREAVDRSGDEPAISESAVAADGLEPAGDDRAESQPAGARHVSASALPLNPMRPAAEPAVRTPSGPASTNQGAAVLDEPIVSLTALTLELLDDSWIEIRDAEGTRLEYDLLRAGQQRQYQGQAPFELLVGRSSAIRLLVDGQAVTWEGDDSGDVAELAITADGEIQR